MKFLLDSRWETPAIYRTIPGEASLSEEEDDPLESTSCFLYCLLFCTPALSGESSDPLLLSPSYNTFHIFTYCIPTGDVIFKKGVKLSFIYIKQWNIILELCVNSCPQVYCESNLHNLYVFSYLGRVLLFGGWSWPWTVWTAGRPWTVKVISYS